MARPHTVELKLSAAGAASQGSKPFDHSGHLRVIQDMRLSNLKRAPAIMLIANGRCKEARQQVEKAAQLDPTSLVISTNVGITFYCARDYTRAIEHRNSTSPINARKFGDTTGTRKTKAWEPMRRSGQFWSRLLSRGSWVRVPPVALGKRRKPLPYRSCRGGGANCVMSMTNPIAL
jgi:hypothetical protein